MYNFPKILNKKVSDSPPRLFSPFKFITELSQSLSSHGIRDSPSRESEVWSGPV